MLNVTELSLVRVRELLSSGAATSQQVTAAYLDQIERYNNAGPRLNSIRETNPNALEIAAALDQERRGGRIRSPLHGVPILIKDNIGTDDQMRTTAGTKALADLRTPFDATIVRKLRAAGAVILGKCNCPDFCDYVSSTMPSEHSTAGGLIRHPYGFQYRRGGGSSTGVAAAVASSMAAAGIGSETQNSLQAPCSNTSLVGIKPTVGLVSRAGIVPLAISQDTAGPVARSVKDATLLLSAMAGPDFDDTLTLNALGALKADYSSYCVDGALVGKRIGVAHKGMFGRNADSEIDAIVEKAIAAMHDAGAVIIDPADIPSAPAVAPLASRVFRTDFKAGLNAFLKRCGDRTDKSDMRSIIRFNDAQGMAAIPYGQDLLLASEQTAGDWSEAVYHADRARDLRLSREEGIDHAIRTYRLDAIVAPMDYAAKLTGKAGYPVISVPCGYTSIGEPVGVTFIGMAWTEPTLIAIAHGFEQLGPHRVGPRLQ